MRYIYMHVLDIDSIKKKKGWINPESFQETEAPRFKDSRHMKAVSLSALRTRRFYSQNIFLVLISVGA